MKKGLTFALAVLILLLMLVFASYGVIRIVDLVVTAQMRRTGGLRMTMYELASMYNLVTSVPEDLEMIHEYNKFCGYQRGVGLNCSNFPIYAMNFVLLYNNLSKEAGEKSIGSGGALVEFVHPDCPSVCPNCICKVIRDFPINLYDFYGSRLIGDKAWILPTKYGLKFRKSSFIWQSDFMDVGDEISSKLIKQEVGLESIAIKIKDFCVKYGTAWTTGKYGNALSFDGVDDYVEVPDSTSLNPSEFTISFWAKPDSMGNWARWIGKAFTDGFPSPNNKGWIILRGDSNWIFLALFSEIHSHYIYYTPGEWMHVAFTFGNNKLTAYKNGVEVGTTDATGYSWTFTTAPDYPLRIGRGDTYPPYFNGIIDEVRIYNRALEPTEITALYSTDTATWTTTGLVVNWKFDETSGITANDETTNNNDGTVNPLATEESYDFILFPYSKINYTDTKICEYSCFNSSTFLDESQINNVCNSWYETVCFDISDFKTTPDSICKNSDFTINNLCDDSQCIGKTSFDIENQESIEHVWSEGLNEYYFSPIDIDDAGTLFDLTLTPGTPNIITVEVNEHE